MEEAQTFDLVIVPLTTLRVTGPNLKQFLLFADLGFFLHSAIIPYKKNLLSGYI